MIDRFSTTVAEIGFDKDDEPFIAGCRSIRVGTRQLMDGDSGRPLRKIGDLLKKMKAETTTLCIHPDRFYPLDALFAATLDREAFDAQCRAEAGYFLKAPERYRYDAIPYSQSQDGSRFSKYLLLFYPQAMTSAILNGLEPFSRIDGTMIYLNPLVGISALMEQKLCLLELEPDYAAFSVSANGRLEYYRYWELKEPGEAEYFALYELESQWVAKGTAVHIAGILGENKEMIGRIKKASDHNLVPFDASVIMPGAFGSKTNAKATPAALKALGTIPKARSGTV